MKVLLQVPKREWIFGLALALMAGAAPGQEPELVRDIATGPAYSPGSVSSAPVRLRNEAFFPADDGFLGRELWASNGTPRGTRLVADLCPGRCPGNPWMLTPSGGLLFFYAGNTTGGVDSFWLWRSDGTTAGTFPLVDLEIFGFGSAGPVSFLAPLEDGVVFIVHDRVRQAWSLWRSDGTQSGTREVRPLPGRYSPVQAPSDSEWARVLDDAQHHYFRWRGRLWVTDGTAEGTRRASVPVTPCGGAARLGELTILAAEETPGNCEPWVSDGTERGTRLLRDIWRGEPPSIPEAFVTAGGFVYFTAFDGRHQRQLWRTDGTARGTVVVRAPGGGRWLGEVAILGAAGSRLYFIADDGAHGIELWRTDGSAATTALVADLSPGAASTVFAGIGQSLGDRLIFTAQPQGEVTPALYRTEGTTSSTVRLTTGSDFYVRTVLTAVGKRVYFTAVFPEEHQELGVTDGTIEGTRVFDLAHPALSSDPYQLIAASEGLVFVARPTGFDSEAWRSGGHPEDTAPLADLRAFFLEGVRLTPGSGGAFYYTFDEQRFGWTDGQTARDLLPPRGLSFPQSFIDLGGRTVFFAARPVSETAWQPWVWSSDGTPEGTSPVAAAGADLGGAYSFLIRAALVPETGDIRFMVRKEDDVSFLSRARLSATDGTTTRELLRISIQRFQVLDQLVAAGRYAFVTFRSDYRSSLWASDGTAEGTHEVYAVSRPWDLSFVSGLTPAGEQVFFLGDDFEHGRELWASDGTPEGTRRVADLVPGAASSNPSDLAPFGDLILFSADDGEHGRELWVSDGTEEGTRLLEIHPGPRGSYPQAFRVIDGRVVFAADDGVHGLELWVTDGTPEGTRLAADVMPGPRASSPRHFTLFEDELFFNAGRPQLGYELWKLPLTALEP